MRFKTKADISYFKFLEMTESIEDETDAAQVLEAAFKYFKPRDMVKFSKALETDAKIKPRFKLDLDFSRAGRFIDADTYRQDGEVLEMLKCILVPRRKWHRLTRHRVEDISLQEAERVLGLWGFFLEDIKNRYEYIFNPPVRLSSGETTQGTIEREAFAAHYGGYAEMTYLIGAGLVKDFKTIWDWELDFFLFWGEYLLRKRDVENIK